MFFRLVKTDLKRITHYAAGLAISACILLVLFTLLALKADDIIYSRADNQPLEIGIVMSADSSYAQMAYATIEDMDSYRASCHFTEVADKNTANDMLESGQLFAFIYVPDNIISDIMDGTNTPVEVYYSDNRSMDTFVLNDLFRSTSSMLGISQAAIYSVQAIGRDMQLPEPAQSTLSDDINTLFLSEVLNRTSIYVTSEINATRTGSTRDFYVSASIILIMLLCGTIFVPYILNVPDAFVTRLRTFGIGRTGRFLSSFISVYIWDVILYVSAYTALILASQITGSLSIHFSLNGLLYGLVAAGAAALIVSVICLIPAGVHGCTLTLITIVLISSYLSGFFVPETMLPNFAKSVCHVSFLNDMAHTLCRLICG